MNTFLLEPFKKKARSSWPSTFRMQEDCGLKPPPWLASRSGASAVPAVNHDAAQPYQCTRCRPRRALQGMESLGEASDAELGEASSDCSSTSRWVMQLNHSCLESWLEALVNF